MIVRRASLFRPVEFEAIAEMDRRKAEEHGRQRDSGMTRCRSAAAQKLKRAVTRRSLPASGA